MAKQTISTLKNWFRTTLKPTQAQFWDWLDSFWHKDEAIPSASIDGLQALLDAKVNVSDLVKPSIYDPLETYTYDVDNQQYVSFSNPESADQQYQYEGFYRLTHSADPGEDPETNPEFWSYQGREIGSIGIDDVVGLNDRLDEIYASIIASGFEVLGYSLSDADSALLIGEKDSQYIPFDFEAVSAFIAVNVAPTGSNLIIDIEYSASSIFSTLPAIVAGSYTSITNATQPVFTKTTFAKGDRIDPILDQVGATVVGEGLKLYIIGNKI